jgi:transmembrane sensor
VSTYGRTLRRPDAATRQAAAWFARLRAEHVEESERIEFEKWRASSPANRSAFERFERLWATAGRFADEPIVTTTVNEACQRMAARTPVNASTDAPRRAAEGEWPAQPTAWHQRSSDVASESDQGRRAQPQPAAWHGRSGHVSTERGHARHNDGASESGHARGVSAPPAARRTQRHYAVAASIGFAVVASLALFFWVTRFTYATSVGERRVVALDDGSRVTLNTNTRIRIDYSDTMRIVRLDRGQAYFQVAHEARRPFEVITGNSVVRAVGTAFDVYEHGDETLVTLVEGVVKTRLAASTPADEPAQLEQIVRAGQKVALVRGHRAAVLPAAVDRSTAWLNGKLMFNDEPLSAAVAEANRYSKHQVKLGSPSLRDLRVSGVFRAGNQAELVQALGGYFSIQVREDENGDFVLLDSSAGALP